MHVVSDCQEQFNFVLSSVQLARRAEKFVNKLHVDLYNRSVSALAHCTFIATPQYSPKVIPDTETSDKLKSLS